MNGEGRRPSIRDVAQRAGVSPSSVSRALNGYPEISDKTRARVARAAEELGYQPDFLGRSLRLGATPTMGFLVRDISRPLFAEMFKGAEQVLEQEGYSLLLMNSLRKPLVEASHIRLLCQRRVEGLMVSLTSENSPDTRTALHEAKVPVVLLDRELEDFPVDAVQFNHVKGVNEATTALISSGHRRLGLILGSLEIRPSRERLRAFVAASDEAKIPSGSRRILEVGTFNMTAALKLIGSMLDAPEPPTAVIAGDSELGVALLTALSERGLHQGRDIDVVICDELELMPLMDPPISVVQRDADIMGAAAARLLLRRIANPSAEPRQEVLPTCFIDRRSSATRGTRPFPSEGPVSPVVRPVAGGQRRARRS
jgi:LacI family transcriptional regulator